MFEKVSFALPNGARQPRRMPPEALRSWDSRFGGAVLWRARAPNSRAAACVAFVVGDSAGVLVDGDAHRGVEAVPDRRGLRAVRARCLPHRGLHGTQDSSIRHVPLRAKAIGLFLKWSSIQRGMRAYVNDALLVIPSSKLRQKVSNRRGSWRRAETRSSSASTPLRTGR